MKHLVAAGLVCAGTCANTQASIGYGVDANGRLFRFSLLAPGPVPTTTIGNLGFVPEGIDFRPGTPDLYAVDVGPETTQLYRVNIETGAATAVGAGFASASPSGAYNLTGRQTFGFDFNPTTLQVDNSMRIRMVSSGGANLRLHSGTGGLAAIDGALSYGGNPVPGVDGAAYINSANGTAGGTTQLFVMDAVNNQLAIQSPPNAGVLTAVGSFGFGIDNTLPGISFDILTETGSVDPTIGGDAGYAVLRRPNSPPNALAGSYLLYDVNLGTGAITMGRLVGAGDVPEDFTGGFAVSTFVPGPGASGVMLLAALVAGRRCRGV